MSDAPNRSPEHVTQPRGDYVAGDQVVGDKIAGDKITYNLERPLSRQERRNRASMLERVREFWIKEMLENSLHGAASIPLSMEEKAKAVEHPLNMELHRRDRPDRKLEPGTRIIDMFDKMGGKLLILGAPGSGKTTTLLELARDLIDRAEADESQPMPVVLNLSSWAGERKPFAEWLVDELSFKYQVPRKLGKVWVDKGELLLLLDGLDEVSVAARDACVEAINRFLPDEDSEAIVSVVVCSRTAEYEKARQLRLHGAVVLKRLTYKQVDTYLADLGDQAAPLRALLQRDSSLRESARSPLVLGTMISVPAEKLQALELRGAWRKHLFDAYVEQMLEKQEPAPRYTREATIHWLVWLARMMLQYGQTVFFIERIQPTWLPTRRHRWLYAIGVGLVVGLFFALYGKLLVVDSELSSGKPVHSEVLGVTTSTLTCGPFLSIFPVLVALLFAYLIGPTGGRFFRLLASLAGGIVSGLVVMLASEPMFGPIFALNAGFMVGVLGFAMLEALGLHPSRGKIEIIETLSWSWSKAVKGLIPSLLMGLLPGMIGALAYSHTPNPPLNLAVLVILVTLSGLIVMGAVGFVSGGLAGGELADSKRVKPNQGVWRSAWSAIRVTLAGGIIGGLVVLLGAILYFGLIFASLEEVKTLPLDVILKAFFMTLIEFANPLMTIMVIGIAVGTVFGFGFSMMYGGIAVIQHLTLRLILWRVGYMPFNYARFLDYCHKRILLRKIGGGYIFLHRLLQEYFASLDTSPPSRAQ